METTEKAYAKLNYSLDVLGKRPDGYHELCMVMGSVDLSDEVTVTLRRDGEFTVKSNFAWLPGDDRNLGVRAAKAFFSAVGEEGLGADIRMLKRIPVGAGMAGGSSDAAAVLRALNRLAGAGLSDEKLRGVGLSVGSDVPYCVTGGMALAQGRGEILTPLPDLPECRIVIVKPSFSVSTADLFREIDKRRQKTRPDTSGLMAALSEGSLAGVARRMYNVFEDVLPRSSREVGAIRGELLSLGALGSVMTGTGSAVFGLFGEEAAARRAWESLSSRYRDCFLCRPVPAIAE